MNGNDKPKPAAGPGALLPHRCTKEHCGRRFNTAHGLAVHVVRAHQKHWASRIPSGPRQADSAPTAPPQRKTRPRETIETAPPTGLPELPRNFHCVGCGMDLDDYLRAYMLVKRARGQR